MARKLPGAKTRAGSALLLSRPSNMSDQPQLPIQQLLAVPDLVWNVFERLDAASRQAFFQAHRDVAQNGHVLAHAKLRIDLGPQSLEDQWQRVLRLTRSQPPRCLIVTAPNKEQLQDFLRCVPEGKHGEKQRVLQGTELQLQVYIKLEAFRKPYLHDWLTSWRNDQQRGVEGRGVQLVLDLCGRELLGWAGDDLPSCCTLRNGTLQLPNSCVRVASDRVRLESVVIMGEHNDLDMEEAVVQVVSGGRLEMEGCHVSLEGCGPELIFGSVEAVRVCGAGASLCARGCSMQSNEGNGLVVCDGGAAVLERVTVSSSKSSGLVVCDGGTAALEHVTASSCGMNGVRVEGEGSMVSAAHCCMDGNSWDNVSVLHGAHACLRHCSSDGSKVGRGLDAFGPGSSVEASDSSISSNGQSGAWCDRGASMRLSRVTTCGNGETGWEVFSWDAPSSLVASDSDTSSNKESGAAVWGGSATARLSHVSARENALSGWVVAHHCHQGGSSLEASNSDASSNKRCGVAVWDGASARLTACTVMCNGRVGMCSDGPASLLVTEACEAFDNSWGNTGEASNVRVIGACLDG